MLLLSIVAAPNEKALRDLSKPLAGIGSLVKKLRGGTMETIYRASVVRLASVRFGVPQLLLVIDHSKECATYLPLFVANSARERGRHS